MAGHRPASSAQRWGSSASPPRGARPTHEATTDLEGSLTSSWCLRYADFPYLFKQESFFFGMKEGFWSGAALDRDGSGIHVLLSAFSAVLCWTLGQRQQLLSAVSPAGNHAIMRMMAPRKGGRQLSTTCLMLLCAPETVWNAAWSLATRQPAHGQPCCLSPSSEQPRLRGLQLRDRNQYLLRLFLNVRRGHFIMCIGEVQIYKPMLILISNNNY